MKTTIKYNIAPNDSTFETAHTGVENIIKNYIEKKLPIDELIVEVNDIFTVNAKCGTFNLVHKGAGCSGEKTVFNIN